MRLNSLLAASIRTISPKRERETRRLQFGSRELSVRRLGRPRDSIGYATKPEAPAKGSPSLALRAGESRRIKATPEKACHLVVRAPGIVSQSVTQRRFALGFIPEGARWYLADVVLEHRIDGDPRNLVHVNTHLVEAGGPDEAYEKALALGRGAEGEYANTEGRQVRVVFRGLRQLNVIHEPLEDGAELMYLEKAGVPEEELRKWIQPRGRLGVFAPIERKRGVPNTIPELFKGLVDELEPGEGSGNGPA